MIADRFLPELVTLVDPAVTQSGYGDESLDYGESASRIRNVRARLTQTAGHEVTQSRQAQVADWTLITNNLRLTGTMRVERRGEVFEVLGPVALVPGVGGDVHHARASLRSVAG